MPTTSETMDGDQDAHPADRPRSKDLFPTVIPFIRFKTYDRTLTFNVALLTLGMAAASFVIAFILLSLSTLVATS